MELKRLAAIFLRWKWLLVIGTLLAAVSAFVTSSLITPTFEASTTLQINRTPDTQSSDFDAFLIAERFARTYEQLFTGNPVLEATLTRLGFAMELENLEKLIEVKQIWDTQLIEIKVEHEDPTLASHLANTLVEVFVEQYDALQADRFAASKESLKTQLEKLIREIQLTEAAIADLAIPESDTHVTELERLQTELAQYQISHTNILASYEELRVAEARTISNIIQVEPAGPPEKPVRPRTLINTVLAGFVGGITAFGTVFVIEYLDDTIRSTEDIARVTQLPVIGYVAESKKIATSGIRQRLILLEPKFMLADSFRSLRANIESAGTQGFPQSILVVSPGPDHGKTTIAMQLALSIAQGGKKVVLIDANLRQPRVHDYFGIENKLGFSDMLVDDIFPQVVAQELSHRGLKVITCGKSVDNAAELIGSIRMLKALIRLREQVDVAIFDGPPLVVSESLILASKVESVLIVIQYGRTREAVAKQTIKQLDRSQANLLGITINRVPYSMAKDISGNIVDKHAEYSGAQGAGDNKWGHSRGQVVLRRQPE